MFALHRPDFKVEKFIIESARPDGSFDERQAFVIRDGLRYVALYVPGEKPYLDVIAGPLSSAPVELTMPIRCHYATL